MDREQARFILRSFRPDGADGFDPDFAEALQIAAADRELGAWFAKERAADAAFSAALASVELPEGLLKSILANAAAERGDLPQAEDRFDAAMIGALASIRAPARLREETLAAIASSVRAPARSRSRGPAVFLAAAAGVVFAFIMTRGPQQAGVTHTVSPRETTPDAYDGKVPVEVVQTGFIRTFESPLFHLDESREDPAELVKHLQKRKLPCQGKLPPGLKKAKGVGCRELLIDGKQGSLLCFDEAANGTVHLVIFRREDIDCGSLPRCGTPTFTREGNWAVARWLDEKNVFVLLGATEVEKLESLF